MDFLGHQVINSRRSLFWGAERAADVNAPENVLVHKTKNQAKIKVKMASLFDAVTLVGSTVIISITKISCSLDGFAPVAVNLRGSGGHCKILREHHKLNFAYQRLRRWGQCCHLVVLMSGSHQPITPLTDMFKISEDLGGKNILDIVLIRLPINHHHHRCSSHQKR